MTPFFGFLVWPMILLKSLLGKINIKVTSTALFTSVFARSKLFVFQTVVIGLTLGTRLSQNKFILREPGTQAK